MGDIRVVELFAGAASAWDLKLRPKDIKLFGRTNGSRIKLTNGHLIAMSRTLAKAPTTFAKILLSPKKIFQTMTCLSAGFHVRIIL